MGVFLWAIMGKRNKKFEQRCIVCKKKFKSTSNMAKYCGKDCENKQRRIDRRKRGESKLTHGDVICCKNCDRPFEYVHNGSNRYCSEGCAKDAYNKSRHKPASVIHCKNCEKPFLPHRSDVLYCSDNCRWKEAKERKYKTRRNGDKPKPRVCKYCEGIFAPGPKRSRAMYCSENCKRLATNAKNRKGKYGVGDKKNCEKCNETYVIIGRGQKYCEVCRTLVYGRQGKTHWHKVVLKRDNYTCQDCGATERLVIHHIKSWANYPELRNIVSNGITLCETCHDLRHGFKPRKNQRSKTKKKTVDDYYPPTKIDKAISEVGEALKGIWDQLNLW